MKKIVKRIVSYIIAAITVLYCITYTTIQTANAAMFDIMISITADKEIVIFFSPGMGSLAGYSILSSQSETRACCTSHIK